MTDNERAARALESELLWHDVAWRALQDRDVSRAVAAVYEYGADLDRIYREPIPR